MICFVTVGSTQFDELIDAVTSKECLKALKDLGIMKMIMQTGAGKFDEGEEYCDGISLKKFRYKDNISDEMSSADMIIGHAGAGTCMEALKLRKPLMVVINEQLMDNHQHELADRLEELGCLISTTPKCLAKNLRALKFTAFKPFSQPDYSSLAAEIDSLIGISKKISE